MINSNNKFRIIIATLILPFSLNLFGQTEDVINETYEPGRDTTVLEKDRTDDERDRDARGFYWGSNDGDWNVNIRLGTMFAIGVSTYGHNGSLELPAELDYLSQEIGKSTHVKWDVVRHRIGGREKSVSFEYGLALSYHNYAFTNSTRLVPGQPELTFVTDDVNYKKNKFKSTFLEIPLSISILGDKERDYRGFNLSLGGYAGILLKSKQKFKGPEGKEKVKDDFNLNKFRYGFQGMIGYGHVNLYMQYSLVDLFKENQGPKLTPINIGIVLAGF